MVWYFNLFLNEIHVFVSDNIQYSVSNKIHFLRGEGRGKTQSIYKAMDFLPSNLIRLLLILGLFCIMHKIPLIFIHLEFRRFKCKKKLLVSEAAIVPDTGLYKILQGERGLCGEDCGLWISGAHLSGRKTHCALVLSHGSRYSISFYRISISYHFHSRVVNFCRKYWERIYHIPPPPPSQG